MSAPWLRVKRNTADKNKTGSQITSIIIVLIYEEVDKRMKNICKTIKLINSVCIALWIPFLNVIKPITEPQIRNAKGCNRKDNSEPSVTAITACILPLSK